MMMMAMTAAAAAILSAAQGAVPAPQKGPAPSAFVEPQDPDRIPIPLADLKSLRENNFFSPPKPVKKESTKKPYVSSEPKAPSAPPKPKPPIVTGILLDPETRAYQVVVEDRNEARLKLLKGPMFLKAGDEVLVYRIESVAPNRVVVKWGETTKELKVGESLPDAGLKAPEGAETSATPEKTDAPAETKPAEASSTNTPAIDEEARKKILKELMDKRGKKRKYDVIEE